MLKKNKKYNFFTSKEKHPFHLVDISQLPSVTAFAAMLFVLNMVFYLHFGGIFSTRFLDHFMFHASWFSFSLALFAWFLVVLQESKTGHHTVSVRKGLKYGMIFFIVSEVMFFFAFFWAFFHVSLSPSIAIGGIWPPQSIQALEIWGLPLVNTLLLLSSGITITLAHRALLTTNNRQSYDLFDTYLWGTILLGLTFLLCQGIEYKYGITFHWKENVYASSFFVTTGFHGLHVTIGTIFLLFCLFRTLFTNLYYRDAYIYLVDSILKFFRHLTHDLLHTYISLSSPLGKKVQQMHFSLHDITATWIMAKKTSTRNELSIAQYNFEKNQHLGFETGAWYWHFVDVVWIFLFITVYWWGSY